ncbi:unnamed protein product, partial [Callosobruchus maculatus]
EYHHSVNKHAVLAPARCDVSNKYFCRRTGRNTT